MKNRLDKNDLLSLYFFILRNEEDCMCDVTIVATEDCSYIIEKAQKDWWNYMGNDNVDDHGRYEFNKCENIYQFIYLTLDKSGIIYDSVVPDSIVIA